MRISDWSSDVCSSDLKTALVRPAAVPLNLFVGYLSGGPAPNMSVELRTNFRASWSPPEDYRDWDFDGQPVQEGVVQLEDSGDTTSADLPLARSVPLSSEERPVGKECVSACRYRGLTEH